MNSEFPSSALNRAVERLEKLMPPLQQRLSHLQAENDWLHQQMQQLEQRLEQAILQVEAMMEEQK